MRSSVKLGCDKGQRPATVLARSDRNWRSQHALTTNVPSRRRGRGGSAVPAISLKRCLAADASDADGSARPRDREDVFEFIQRQRGQYDPQLYARILGAANEFKEGDESVGVAAPDEAARQNARTLLANTRLAAIDTHALHQDDLFRFADESRDERPRHRCRRLTLGDLKSFLLTSDEAAIKAIMPGLSSDVIGCVVKLMSNAELD